MKTFLKILSIVFLLIGGFGLFVIIQNSDRLVVTSYEYVSSQLPVSFDGFKIVQLSDMHNHSNDYSNGNIVDTIKKENPNIIVMTGDFVDTHTKNMDQLNSLLSGLDDYPIYFVPGNHEAYSPKTKDFYSLFNAHNKNISLFDSCYIYSNGIDKINIFGLHDPYYDHPDNMYIGRNEGSIDKTLKILTSEYNMNYFSILLSHRPDLADIYSKYKMNVIFSGHTHGGQVNIGFTLGVANSIFPRYVAGEYKLNNDQTMYVSRGLGYSANLPVRMNCDMEVVVTTLKYANA